MTTFPRLCTLYVCRHNTNERRIIVADNISEDSVQAMIRALWDICPTMRLMWEHK